MLVSTYIADEHGRIPAEPQQVFRKNDWTPALPVMDVDGDGYPDLVLGYRHMDDKESVTKVVTAKQLDYNLRFYFHRPGSWFSKRSGLSTGRDHPSGSGSSRDAGGPASIIRALRQARRRF